MKRRDKYTNIGREKFDFDFNLQYSIYKYLYCEKLSDKTYHKMEKEYDFRTYKEWKEYVENKYNLFKKSELKEFLRFLKMQSLKSSNIDNGSQIFYSAVVASGVTLLTNFLIDYLINDFELKNTILFALGYMFIMPFFVYVVYDILSYLFKNKLEIKFYEDYIEIIEKILKHKK